jgi:hypothetical protein
MTPAEIVKGLRRVGAALYLDQDRDVIAEAIRELEMQEVLLESMTVTLNGRTAEVMRLQSVLAKEKVWLAERYHELENGGI